MAKYIKERYGLLIDGQWVDAQNGETFVTTNPASGEQLAVCANASTCNTPGIIGLSGKCPAPLARVALPVPW